MEKSNETTRIHFLNHFSVTKLVNLIQNKNKNQIKNVKR